MLQFRVPFYGDGQSVLNRDTTEYCIVYGCGIQSLGIGKTILGEYFFLNIAAKDPAA